MLRRTASSVVAGVAALAAASALSLAGGCDEGMTGDKGAEDPLPDEGKLDSFARPTEHGVLPFGMMANGGLTATAKYHAWTFSLTGDAKVHMYTQPQLTSRMTVDTVLYLYKKGASGTWGSYIARNDDDGASLWSSLLKNLKAGEYRVLVKGYSAQTYGLFAVTADCEGAGCAAAPAPACFFGTTFGELLENQGYTITGDRQLQATDWLSPLDQQRIVLAVQQSSHTDVTTVAQAFAAVDQQVIRRVDVYDATGGRAFVAFEYGAGDNSYGAVFAYGSTTIVSKIHDGDLEACTARAQVCRLGGDWYSTRTSADFAAGSSRVVTAAGQLSGVDATDALAAIRVAYPEATSLANGLTRIDGGRLNVIDLTHTASGTKLRTFEYGAGDNSYGAIYQAATTTRLSSIVDGTYYDCAF